RNVECLFDRSAAAMYTLGECVAFDEFEDEKAGVVSFLEVVNRRDVGMIQRREHFCLALKPAHTICVSRELFGQDFDSDFAFQLEITCAIYLAHAAFAEQRNYFVGAELSANGQGHDFAKDYRTMKVSGRITRYRRLKSRPPGKFTFPDTRLLV